MFKKNIQESIEAAETLETALTVVERPLSDAQLQKEHESTAAIIQKIFFLRCQGYGFRKIAQLLNEDGDLPPKEYYYQNLDGPDPHSQDKPWNETTVRAVLRQKTCIKHTVQNKPGTVSCKNPKQVDKPKEEWIHVEDTCGLFQQISKMQNRDMQETAKAIQRRLEQLDKLVQSIYEDKVLAQIPETVCVELLNKYQAERTEKTARLKELEQQMEEARAIQTKAL